MFHPFNAINIECKFGGRKYLRLHNIFERGEAVPASSLKVKLNNVRADELLFMREERVIFGTTVTARFVLEPISK